MSDMTKRYITPREAMQRARALGLNANMDTVRRLGRHSNLSKRLGGRIYIDEAGWSALLETGHPDCNPPSERRPAAARKNGV